MALFGMTAATCFAQQASHDFAAITECLKKAVEDAPLDGACLLVVKDGKTIYEQCFGKYKPDTLVSIASASKWLSAATIMTLVDAGKLSLDDSVSKYLPKFTGTKGEITIRQLLSHTSGLPGDHPAIGCCRRKPFERWRRIKPEVLSRNQPRWRGSRLDRNMGLENGSTGRTRTVRASRLAAPEPSVSDHGLTETTTCWECLWLRFGIVGPSGLWPRWATSRIE
jgi:CubicO group peptidase (beta-lactamase class C family)